MASRRRWILRIFLGLLGLLAILVVAVLLVLANLDAGPVKGLIQSQARGAGVELDFSDGAVTLGSIRLRDVKVLSPAADADLAPALVSIATIDGSWSPFSMRVDDLLIKDVTVTLVMNEDGTTSLDRFLAGLPPPAEPPPGPEPLSRLLSALLPEGIAARARVENVKLVVLPRGKGERMELDAPVVAADLAGGKLDLKIGPSEVRAVVGERSARIKLEGALAVARNQLDATLDVHLLEQSFSPEVPPVDHVVGLTMAARFLPEEKKTHVRVDRLTLVDGAATFDLDADLVDAEPVGAVLPEITAANCKIDVAALAKAVPPDLGPITVDADPITCRAEKLSLLPAPRGRLALDGVIRRLVYRDVEVTGLHLGVTARPDGDAFTASVKLPVDKVVMPGLTASDVAIDLTAHGDAAARGGWPIDVDGTIAAGAVATPTERVAGARVGVDATLTSPTTLGAHLTIDVDRVDAAAAVRGVDLALDVKDLVLADDPVLSTGVVTLAGKIREAAQPKGPQAEGVTLDLTARLGGAAPSSAKLALGARRLFVPGLGRDFPAAPLELTLEAPRVEVDARKPAASRGEATLAATYGTMSLGGTVSGSAASVAWDLTAKAQRLGPARALAVATKGTFADQIEQETTIDVGQVATGDASLKGAHVVLRSHGTTKKQDATLSAALDGVIVQGKSAGSPRLDLVVGADLTGPRFDVRLQGKAPDVDLHLAGSIDGKKVARWELDGKVSKLGPIAALLPVGPDWTDVAIDVKGRGVVSGAIRAVQGGVPVLAADPAATARGKQSLDLAVRGVTYKGAAETSAEVEKLTISATAELGEPHKAVVVIEAPELAGVASGVHLAVKGFDARLDAAVTRRGAGDVKLIVHAKEIKQSAFAYYPVRDLEIGVAVNNDPEKAMTLRAGLYNPGAGTKFEVSGEVDQRAAPGSDAVPGRHSLLVDGLLEQSLDKLDGAPERLKARGKIIIPFRVESGDLSLFHTRAVLKLSDVHVDLPQDKISVEQADGEIPIVEEIVMGPEGAEMVGQGKSGVYRQLRFSDYQPFLEGSNFLSIGRVQVGETQLGPIAGNARVDRDVVALDQMEVNALGGKITGQCIIEVRGPDTQVAFRGKVTGIRPGGGTGDERLDAHAALNLVPYKLGLEGRVEIVRIGKGHLLDLLDVWDPYHADVSANRIRLGLKVGYPKQVRLHFAHGFASLAIELGGLAGAVRIDDITGVPIGPALSRFLAPVLEGP